MTPQTNQLTALFLYVVPSSQYTPQCTLQSRRAVKFTGSVRLLEAARHSKSMAALSHCDHIQVRIDFAIAIAIGRRVHCHSLCKLLHASCIEKKKRERISVKADRGEDCDSHPDKVGRCHPVRTKDKSMRCIKRHEWGIKNLHFLSCRKPDETRYSQPVDLNTSPTIYRPEKTASPGRERIHYGDNTGNDCELDGASAYARRIYSSGIPESSSPSYSKVVQDSIKSLVFLNDYPHRKGSRTSELSAVIANMGAEEAVQSRSICIFDDAKESGSRKTRYFDTHREGYQDRKWSKHDPLWRRPDEKWEKKIIQVREQHQKKTFVQLAGELRANVVRLTRLDALF
ncbi:uncharacterized protein C8R40DRAFT_1069847 [Lentinula edodes]|uniref:uncharacterized protein n=1 Tax=Lentinula edodes TaxID=5353 RepID=UPI001E8DC5E1|nr:uncharacterized protein C8R40DRAFT_1069847 [Lentinula edodes]KAH7874941.1 hypothetical protein C8R40DRAFT_1069847 [Lentinula edodes]KAJ3914242.1 hypothetical protein F5877DRAFT_70876 [Lentinula edodes]